MAKYKYTDRMKNRMLHAALVAKIIPHQSHFRDIARAEKARGKGRKAVRAILDAELNRILVILENDLDSRFNAKVSNGGASVDINWVHNICHGKVPTELIPAANDPSGVRAAKEKARALLIEIENAAKLTPKH